MNRLDGTRLSGWQHVRQSIIDILTTPIGTRVMRRDYGARTLELIDRPSTYEVVVEATIVVAEALARWEPRFELRSVKIIGAEPGHLTLSIEGVYVPDGHLRQIEVTI
jgi:phage baseplate assembly protein W